MASQQPYQLLVSNPLVASLDDVAIFQPNDGGATEVGANTWRQIAYSLGIPVTEKFTLSSSQILNMNTVPITFIAAPGAGKLIRPMFQTIKYNFGTTQYSGNAMLTTLGGNNVFSQTTYLATGNAYDYKTAAGFGTSTDLENLPLIGSVSSANPTGGDGTIELYITYTIITL